jgi:hypothetical protein
MAHVESDPATKQDSSLALIWDTEENLSAGLPALSSSWDSKEILLWVQPLEASDSALLGGLKPNKQNVSVTFQTTTALCSVIESVRKTELGQSFWDVRFRVARADFSPDIEMALGNTSADELAAIRARRILLNENPAPPNLDRLRDINAITKELFVGGQGTFVRVQSSPFPELFRLYRGNAERFLDLAWVNAVMNLQLTATVETVESLSLTLRGSSLQVDFRGRRKRRFSNRAPFVISVSGVCSLQA